MRIVADAREEASGVPASLLRLGLHVEVRRLTVGDYAVGRGAIVERKTVRGLHLDLVAGRFWRQLGFLRRRTRLPYLLIEGDDIDDGPLARNAIRAALIAVADQGVSLIRSSSADESAMWLRLLCIRRQNGGARYRAPYAQRPKTPAGSAPAEAALAAIPGISTVTARSLLLHFGSLAAVVAADPREWRQVPGMGPRRSNALLNTLRAAPTTSRSGRSRERRGPST
jgi:ERCC4-type nuclease